MPRQPTAKQEAFARKYVECGNAIEAYRFAYPTSQKWPMTTLHPEASKALRNPTVSTRIEAIQAKTLVKIDVGAADIARVAWQIASDPEQNPGARVSALTLLAKRHPEFSDKHDVSVDMRTQALMAVSAMPLEQLLQLAGGVDAPDATLLDEPQDDDI